MQIAIAGSAKLSERIDFWREWWQKQGAEVLAYPQVGKAEKYPDLYKRYFVALDSIELLFVMNEDKAGVQGYIGAQTFAEMSYVNARNLLAKQQTRIVLLREPAPENACYDEVKLWLDLDWVEVMKGNNS